MQFINKYALVGCLVLPAAAVAQINTFSPGDLIRSSDMNDNFRHLSIMAKEAAHVGPGISVNCEDDVSALNYALDEGYTEIRITAGICQIKEQITNQSLAIIGSRDDDGSIKSAIISSSAEFQTYNTNLTLVDLKVLTPLVTSNGNVILLRSTFGCNESVDGKSNPTFKSYMSAVFARESNFKGCAGIDLRAGATMNVILSSIEPASDENALYIDQTSSIVSERTDFLSQSATRQWQISLNGDAIFRNSLIKGGIYANGARATLQEIEFKDNGTGELRLAAHFGSYFVIKNSKFSNAEISSFEGGNIHIVHDPSEIHDNINFQIDNGRLSFGGAFRGRNISASLTNLSYATLGNWEAGYSQIVNESSFLLGYSSYLKTFEAGAIEGYSVSCFDDLALSEFSDGISCTQPR